MLNASTKIRNACSEHRLTYQAIPRSNGASMQSIATDAFLRAQASVAEDSRFVLRLHCACDFQGRRLEALDIVFLAQFF